MAGLVVPGSLALAACGAEAETAAPEPDQAVVDVAEPAAGETAERTTALVETTPDTQPNREPVLIRFATPHSAGPRATTVRFALDSLEQANPSIFVEYRPAAPDYAGWLATGLAADNAPQVVFGDAAIFQRHRSEHLTDITDPVSKLEWREGAYHFIPDSYTDNRGDMRVPTPRRLRGPLFGLPYSLAIDGWLLNQTLFEAAGVRPPDDAWTWNDAVDLGRKLTDPSLEQWGILAANSPQFFWIPLLYSNGVRRPFLEDRSGTGWLVDGDAASEAFEWAVDLIHEAKIAPPAAAIAQLRADTGEPFSSGRLGMLPSGAVHATGYLAPRIGERFSWALARSPISPATGVAAHAWQASAHFVTTSAATPDVVEAAVAVAAHFTSPAVQNKLASTRAAMPALVSAAKTSGAIAPPPQNLVVLRDALEDPRTRHLFTFFPTWPEWLQAQADAAAGAFAGILSPDEALIAMVRDGDMVLDRWHESRRAPNSN